MSQNVRRQSEHTAHSTPRKPAGRPWQRLVRAALVAARVFIVYTRNTPIFATLYRVCASLLLRRTVAALRKHPAIVSIYLRRSFSSGQGVVGLSDFDLGVVVESPKDRELETKQAVYKRYLRAVRGLPRGAFDTNLSIYTPDEIRDLLFDLDVRGLIDAHLAYRLLEGISGWTLLHGARALPSEAPDYPAPVRRLILSRELLCTVHEMNTVYRSYQGYEYPDPYNRLARIALRYSVYKRVSDAIRTFVLCQHPELPLAFSRTGSIELGLEYMGDLLLDCDLAFLREVRGIGERLLPLGDTDRFFLEYHRFALRLTTLIRTRLASEWSAQRAAAHQHVGSRDAMMRVWYPEFCGGQAGAEPFQAAPTGRQDADMESILAPFRQTVGIDSENLTVSRYDNPCLAIPPHNERWFLITLRVDPGASVDELRLILDAVRAYGRRYRERTSDNLLLDVVLDPRGTSASPVTQAHLITAHRLASPTRNFSTLHPSLFLTESAPLGFQYVMFWSLMARYAEFCMLLNNLPLPSSSLVQTITAEDIMALFRQCLLPHELLDCLVTVFDKYHAYLNGTGRRPTTYSEFIFCALRFEEYLNAQRQAAASG